VSSKTQLQAPAADWGEEADFAEVPTALPTDDEVRNRGKKPTQSYRNPSNKNPRDYSISHPGEKKNEPCLKVSVLKEDMLVPRRVFDYKQEVNRN